MTLKKIETIRINEHETKTVYYGTKEDMIDNLESQKATAGNEDMLRSIDQTIKKVRRMGRKPKPAEKLRDLKCTARFNESEYLLIQQAIGDDTEFAAGLRELALEAARNRIND